MQRHDKTKTPPAAVVMRQGKPAIRDRRQVHGKSHLIFKSDKLSLNILSERQELKNPPNAIGSELKTAAPISLCCLGTLFAQLPQSSRTHMISEYSAPPPAGKRKSSQPLLPAARDVRASMPCGPPLLRSLCRTMHPEWSEAGPANVENLTGALLRLGVVSDM